MVTVFASTITLTWVTVNWATGGPLRWTPLAIVVLPILYFFSAALYLQRRAFRSGEPRPRFQFGIAFLLVTMTVAAVWLAMARWDHEAMLARHERRTELEAEFRRIVGAGEVHLSQQLVMQVKRPSFDDGDLRRVLALEDELHEIESSFFLIDLSHTAVTDDGVAQLAACGALEYLFLSGTAVEDAGFQRVAGLPLLKMIAVDGARVSQQALAKIRTEHPQLQVTPLPGGK